MFCSKQRNTPLLRRSTTQHAARTLSQFLLVHNSDLLSHSRHSTDLPTHGDLLFIAPKTVKEQPYIRSGNLLVAACLFFRQPETTRMFCFRMRCLTSLKRGAGGSLKPIGDVTASASATLFTCWLDSPKASSKEILSYSLALESLKDIGRLRHGRFLSQ